MNTIDSEPMLPRRKPGDELKIPSEEQLENALKQSEEMSTQIILLMPCNVFWKNTKGEFLGCNKVVADIFHLSDPQDIVGKTNYDLFDKDLAGKATEIDNVVLNQEKSINTEEIGLNAKGEIVTYLTTKTPMYNKQGKLIGLLGVSQDITDKKKLEAEAVEKQILTEKLLLTEAFAGFMAHELRTPIATLNNYLDVIVGNEMTEDQQQRQENLEEIIAKGKQTVKEANIFIDMLLFKLRNMGKKIDKEKLNPCVMFEDVSDALERYPFTEEEKGQVTFDKKNAFIYLGDSLHTQHLILNLLKNALKVIREEGKGHITISFEQALDCNKLIFTDTAKGISPEFLPTIFDAFISKDSSKKGTGLGLAYCKMIMQDYGGDIICESKLGEYTKFICTFPKFNMDEL